LDKLIGLIIFFVYILCPLLPLDVDFWHKTVRGSTSRAAQH
jgi:hypothetical protein